MKKPYEEFLKRITNICDKYDLKDYHAFIYWFCETIFAYSEKRILDSICDGTHDKGVDAVIIDTDERKVVIIQSKYERDGNQTQAKENDIKLLASVRNYFKTRSSLDSITHNANQTAKRLFNDAFDKIKKDKYELELIFITTHKEIPNIDRIMKNTLGFKKGEYALYFYNEVILKYTDSLRGFTPDIGTHNLRYDDRDKTMIKTLKSSAYNSWVVSVPLDEIRLMVNRFKDNLFRKNVRDFLGKNVCNRGIMNTLNTRQDLFWYFNNGITILADEASIIPEEGYIRLKNPQVVNGCQTVRSIQQYNADLKGNLLVRVIESREHEFIDELTLYQNTSNPVNERDLKSNDPIQVRLKHQFEHKKIYYEIKRGQEFHKMKKKYPSYKQMFVDVINNEGVAKLLVVVRISPYIALNKGSKLFFGSEYENIFNNGVTTNKILALIYLNREIQDEYKGKKDFHEFEYHYIFKTRATILVLGYIYDSISHLSNWENKFVKYYENLSDKDYEKFRKKLEKIVARYFNIIYKSYRKSKEPYHNTYLQAKDTYKNIKKENREQVDKLIKQTRDIFAKSL